jgi:hypothetical protein
MNITSLLPCTSREEDMIIEGFNGEPEGKTTNLISVEVIVKA